MDKIALKILATSLNIPKSVVKQDGHLYEIDIIEMRPEGFYVEYKRKGPAPFGSVKAPNCRCSITPFKKGDKDGS